MYVILNQIKRIKIKGIHFHFCVWFPKGEAWRLHQMEELLQETTNLILKKENQFKIKENILKLGQLLQEKEVELERLEAQNVDTTEEERMLLDWNKRFDRLEQMSLTLGATIPMNDSPQNLNNHELIQLHERIIDQQDTQLDSLSELLKKHKQIGEMISTELDTQVELLEEVGEQTDRTHANMNRGMRRMDNVLQSSESKAFCIMIILFLFLILLIILLKIL
jgi:hypothetical protein